MLDISFTELAVIGAVALVVLGPERLPKVARTAGHLFGRLQRYVNTVKADISREMEASELSKLKQDVQDAARSFEQSIQQHANSLESEAKSLETEAKALQVDAENALATPPAATATASPAAAIDHAEPVAGTAAAIAPPPAGKVAAAPASTTTEVGQGMFDFGIEPVRKPVGSAGQQQPQ
ncbi:MAG TPA: Sec-independent protein translocase protein TatB [Usitatibacteraceae bacterium]